MISVGKYQNAMLVLHRVAIIARLYSNIADKGKELSGLLDRYEMMVALIACEDDRTWFFREHVRTITEAHSKHLGGLLNVFDNPLPADWPPDMNWAEKWEKKYRPTDE